VTASHRAIALMAGFSLAWVLLEEVVGRRLQGQYHLLQIVWCRYAVHLVVMALLFGWRQPERLWQTRRPWFQLSRSLLMLVMPLTFAMSLQAGLQVGSVWAVFWAAPLLVLLIVRATSNERVPAIAWVVAAGCGVATAVIMRPADDLLSIAAWMPLAMALSFAAYVVMTRSLRHETVRANLFYTALGVFIVLTPLQPSIWVMPTLRDALVLAAIGIVGLFTLLLLDRAAALSPLWTSTPFAYVHAPALLALAWVSHRHAPSLTALAAAAVIAGLLTRQWWSVGPVRPAESPLTRPGERAL
jgi:drug/metabolite transporter (DMT)-like permease